MALPFSTPLKSLKSHFPIIMVRWIFQHLTVMIKCISRGGRNKTGFDLLQGTQRTAAELKDILLLFCAASPPCCQVKPALWLSCGYHGLNHSKLAVNVGGCIDGASVEHGW